MFIYNFKQIKLVKVLVKIYKLIYFDFLIKYLFI